VKSVHVRPAWLVLATACASSALTALTGCGGGNGQVSVAMSGGSGPFKPGDTPQFTVRVTNHGPGDAPGVEVRVDLPGSFRYKSTANPIHGLGNARTQPVDANVGVSDPQWGFWDLAAPNPSQPPEDVYSHVDITFTVEVGGSPGTYTLTGHAQGDNTAGIVNSSPISLNVTSAPRLSLTATVSPAALKGNSVATYRVTITNSGDGVASNVSVLIALPPVMGFQQSVTPFAGNAARSNPIDPVKNSVEVFYGGFVLPPDSSAGPGIVTIIFKATVVTRPSSGKYPLSIQVTDDANDQLYLVNAAPVSVTGAPASPGAGSATPSATPGL
jgi:uncharacterized repeat protein (TIGR01451 family)